MSTDLKAAPWQRTSAYRTPAGHVSREARTINGAAIITIGESLGHDEWVDGVTLEQVATLGGKLRNGAKARFTHPGLCADGLGKHLGRWTGFHIQDNKVVADLDLARVADTGPEGKLGEYVMDLAEEDPQAFGTSIVFQPDEKAMEAFMAGNRDKSGAFKSPDPANKNNYPHMRLSKLRAVDVVDDPAANPDGFFSDGEELAAKADAILSWAFGLSDRAPVSEDLSGMEPERVRTFVRRFLDTRGLALSPAKQEATDMVTNAKQTPETPAKLAAEEPKKEPEKAAEPDGDEHEPKKEPSIFACAKCGAKHMFALAPDDPAPEKKEAEDTPHKEPDGDEKKEAAKPAESYDARFTATMHAAGLTADEQKAFRSQYHGEEMRVVNLLAKQTIAARAKAVGEAGPAPSQAEQKSTDKTSALSARYEALKSDPEGARILARFPTVADYLKAHGVA